MAEVAVVNYLNSTVVTTEASLSITPVSIASYLNSTVVTTEG